MLSKLSETELVWRIREQVATRSPRGLSFALHLSIFVGVFIITLPKSEPEKVKVNFEVLEQPKVAQAIKIQPKPKTKPKPVTEKRKVFGLNRKALTTSGGVGVKLGNTVAKDFDDKTLRKSDDDLPIPTADYLVSSMPVLQSEFRIPYPREAKRKKIEGPVVMDILIDASGRVREAELVTGPGYGLDEAAMDAVYRFQFRPAEVDGKPVAVRIRYIYRFVLENS